MADLDSLLDEFESELLLGDSPSPTVAGAPRATRSLRDRYRHAAAVKTEVSFSTYDTDAPPAPVPEPGANSDDAGAAMLRNLPAAEKTLAPSRLPKLKGATVLTPLVSERPTKDKPTPTASETLDEKAGKQLREALYWRGEQAGGILPMPRWGHSVVPYKAEIFTFGGTCTSGDGRTSVTNDFHVFKTAGREWQPAFVSKGAPPPAVFDHTACASAGKMIVFGGSGGPNMYYNHVYTFSFETQVWEAVLPNGAKGVNAPTPRSGHSAVAHSRKVYIFGGRSNQAPRKGEASHSADPVSPSDTPVPPRGSPVASPKEGNRKSVKDILREWQGAEQEDTPAPETKDEQVMSDEEVGEVPSEASIHYFNAVQCLDLKARKWKIVKTATDVVPHPRSNHAATSVAGLMYIYGGSDGTTAFSDIFEFDFELSAWREVCADRAIPRRRPTLWGLPDSSVRGGAGHCLLLCGGAEAPDSPCVQVLEISPSASPTKSRQSWGDVPCCGAGPGAQLSGASGAVVRGFLHLFGGQKGPVSTNATLSTSLYNDVIVERYSIAEVLHGVFVHAAEHYSDVCIVVDRAETVCAHKCILWARAPKFLDFLKHHHSQSEAIDASFFESEESEVLVVNISTDVAAARETCVTSYSLLATFVRFLYDGKVPGAVLDDPRRRSELQELAVHFSVEPLVVYLAARGTAVAGGRRKTRTSADPLKLEAEAEAKLGASIASLLEPAENGAPPFGDVVLVCSDGEVHAHKCILASASSFFRKHIAQGGRSLTVKEKLEKREKRLQAKEQMKRSKTAQGGKIGDVQRAFSKITLDETRENVLRVVRFFYSGDSRVTIDSAHGDMKIAKRFHCSHMTALAELVVLEELKKNYSLVCDWLTLADAAGASQLKEQCIDLLAAHFGDLKSTSGYTSLAAPLKAEVGAVLVAMGTLPGPRAAPTTTQKGTDVYAARARAAFGDGAAALAPPDARGGLHTALDSRAR